MHGTAKIQAQEKLGYINAMRGIAILLVVLVHAAQRVPDLTGVARAGALYGQMGVQMFFIASAFTLCLTMERRAGEAAPLRSFYIRRLFRIAPLYYVGIAIYASVAISGLWLGTDWQVSGPYSAEAIIANMLFVHGFVPQANNNIVPGGWSIGTEMAFYLVFPLLFALARRRSDRSIRVVLWMLATSLVASLTAFRIAAGDGVPAKVDSFLYFNLLTQLPVFLLGMLAYFCLKADGGWPLKESAAAQACGFVVFSAALALSTGRALSPALVPAFAGASFVCVLFALRSWTFRVRWLEEVGRVSFSMYIFHFLFAWLVFPPVAQWVSATFSSIPALVVTFLGVSAGTYAIALLTEQWIEKRGIRFGGQIISKIQMQRINAMS
jgi:peptidoglycan/LPS O-acetylase OafA/YrhL